MATSPSAAPLLGSVQTATFLAEEEEEGEEEESEAGEKEEEEQYNDEEGGVEEHSDAMADTTFSTHALTAAVLDGDEERVHTLLHEGWDVNGSDYMGMWPLLVAVKCQHTGIVQMLVDRGAKSKKKRKRSELHVLADLEKGPFPFEERSLFTLAFQQWLGNRPYACSIRMWKLIISAGASPDSSDRSGVTAFHIACGRGNWPVVQYLLDEGLVQRILNKPDRKGDTPLHYAARYGHKQVVTLLLSHGADSLVEGKCGHAADVARAYGHSELAQMIKVWSFNARPLLHVPYDALLHVFDYLEPQDLCAVAQVCKALHDISSADVLWHKFCPGGLQQAEEGMMTYKKSYMSWVQPRLKQYARSQGGGGGVASSSNSSQQQDNYDVMFKFNLLGDAGVGKTSLLSRFAYDTFYNPYHTVGIEFSVKTVEHEGYLIKLQIWDTAVHVRFRSIARSYYRGSRGVLLMYDITCRSSFENIERWVDQLKHDIPEESFPPLLLVATKRDLGQQRTVSVEEGKEMAQRIDAVGFCETSSLTSDGVTEAFMKMASGALRTIDPFYGRQARYVPPRQDYLKALYAKTPAGIAAADRRQAKASCLLQ